MRRGDTMEDERDEAIVGSVADAVERLDSEEIQLPAVIERNATRVERSFWNKLARVAAAIPFAEDLVAAYYCTRDPQTPMRVRAVLLAALAYFIVPMDAIPDFIAVFGFTDDMTVLATAIAMVAKHLKPQHREAAVAALAKVRGDHGDSAV
jgi:uncharacterized membrane protein YkvA (DUF1232 family)